MIEIRTQVPLAPHTTIGVGGNANEFVIAHSDQEIIEGLNYSGPILLLGGGSNLLISDAGFAGRVIQIKSTGLSQSNNLVTVAAGENWDDFVNWAIANGYGNLAPLTGIPGTVGATPIQNVGAYGTEVKELIHSVTVFDREVKDLIELSNLDCDFSYRNSIFKKSPNKYVVLKVTFTLEKTNQVLVSYDELAAALNIEVGSTADASAVRDAVRKLRAGKGMILNPLDRDTYSVGSFFLNPRVDANLKNNLPEDVPAWKQQDGSWKISAAWLISQAGFTRGYAKGEAAISTKHTLALCNLGSASSAQILMLAEEIKNKVESQFGIRLQIEPTTV